MTERLSAESLRERGRRIRIRFSQGESMTMAALDALGDAVHSLEGAEAERDALAARVEALEAMVAAAYREGFAEGGDAGVSEAVAAEWGHPRKRLPVEQAWADSEARALLTTESTESHD